MPLGLNLNSLISPGQSSTPTDQPAAISSENTGATSASDNATSAEASSGASQTSDAKQSQVVQPVNTDVAVTSTALSDAARTIEASELDEFAARQFAIKARAESIVAALVDAISAPINASELAAVDAAEAELKNGEAQKAAAQQMNGASKGAVDSTITDG